MKKLYLFLLTFLCVYGSESSPPPVSNRPAQDCKGFTGLFVTGEFIYWKARQEELMSIAKFDFSQNATDRFISLKAMDLNFKFSPGCKVGVGWKTPYDGWDLYVNWTHLHNHPVTNFKSSTHDLINVEGLGGGVPFVSNHVRESYELMFNSIDFDCGRRFFVSDSWVVRPSFGMKTAWLHQKIKFNYENVQTIPLPGVGAIQGFPEFLSAKNNYWGIGPYFAFNGKWVFGWGLGLYGQVSGAILWGSMEQEAKADENSLEGPDVILTHIHQKGDTHRVRPTVQMFVGLDWEWCFIPNRLSTQVRLGYETQFYFAQLLNIRGIEESDLSLEGLTLSGRLDF